MISTKEAIFDGLSPTKEDIVDDSPVNNFIADKNVVTKIMNNSTGLQRI